MAQSTSQSMCSRPSQLTHVIEVRTKKVENLDGAYNFIAIEVSPAGEGTPRWRSEEVDVTEGLCIIDTWARLPVQPNSFDVQIKVGKCHNTHHSI